MVDRFARLIDEDNVDHVVEWINTYIHGPWSEERLKFLEPTPEERAASIKKYITWRIETSVTERIKREQEDERKRRAETGGTA